MTTNEADAIAACLSPGQRSTILGLDETPALLGCSEPTAIRLLKPSRTRPALTIRTPVPGDFSRFSLNADGLAVKAAIERLPA